MFRRLVEGGHEDAAEVTEHRLHLAFLLFVAGGLLLLASAVILVTAQLFPYTFELSMRFVLRHAGGVIGGIGATALFVGIVAALSTRPYMRWLAAAGGFIALAGTAGFAYAYPYHWGVGQDLSVPVILTLTAGFTLLVGSTFAAVVSNLILRQRIRAKLRDELGREPTDEEVERDVERALADYEYTWGGVAKDTTKGLSIREESFEGYEMHGWKFQDEELDDSLSIAQSTQMLTQLRGGVERQGTIALDGVDQKGAALAHLRQEKAKEEAARPINRLKAWFGRLWARLRRRKFEETTDDPDQD